MKTDVGIESPKLSEVKEYAPNEVNGELAIDLSHKLFLLGRLYEKNKKIYRLGGSAISESILLDTGIYIAPNECSALVKKYSFILSAGKEYGIFFAVISVLLYIAIDGSFLTCLLAIMLLPLISNFYNGIIVFTKLLYFNPKKLLPSAVTETESLVSTAIIIASRNEPFDVAKMTFDSAMALVYPSGKKEIIVVDNSDTTFAEYESWKNYVESFEVGGSSYIDGVRVVFIHRDGKEGFKPRNLDMALEAVTAEFILYLDVDSTVLDDTLLRVIPMFSRDPQLGFIQLFTVPTNAQGTSALSLVQGLRNYFLRLETVFYTHSSHALFYGHNAVWRTKTVREIGECLEYHNGEVVVTEDLSMSFRARFKGYYGIGAWIESGEWIPESMRETEAMWLRWTVGTYQVYAKHFTKLDNLKKFTRQELMGWLQHIGVSINYGLLPLYVALGLVFNSALLMSMVVLSLLPEIIQGVSAYVKLSLGNMNPLKKIFKCYSAFMILGAFINWIRFIGLLRYLTGKKQGWTPTGKSREGDISFIQAIASRFGFLSFGVVVLAYSIFSLMFVTGNLLENVLVVLCGFYGFNCILAVLLFGKSSMNQDTTTAVAQGCISNYKKYYLK